MLALVVVLIVLGGLMKFFGRKGRMVASLPMRRITSPVSYQFQKRLNKKTFGKGWWFFMK